MSPFCAACGNSLASEDRFCRVCGRDNATNAMPALAATPFTPGLPAQTSGKAIVSLVCGLLFVPPLCIVAIICGHLSLSEIRKSAGNLQGQGLAIAGLVLGYLGAVSIPLVLIIAAIAIPNLLRARMAANESSAVATVRAIVTAETSYSSLHPVRGYTCSLSDLTGQNLISRDVESGQRHGYSFELSNCSPETTGGPNAKFQIAAHPTALNQTGIRAFCTDESAVIRVDANGSAERCLQQGELLQ